MAKILVVYYSRTGTTKQVALTLAQVLGCDQEEIISIKNRQGFWGYLISGKEATLKQLAQIKPIVKNSAAYDLVIIGTPIWSFNVSSPVRTYLKNNQAHFKKVAFFCTMGGSDNGRTFKEMEKVIGMAPEARLSLITKEVANNQYAEKVKKFIVELKI
jgi:flavodoxin